MRKLCSIALLMLILTGCSMFRAQRPVLLMPEDRIYTIPGGKPVELLLDNKPITMTFPDNSMKAVHTTTLVKQEERLNKETLKRVKTTKQRNAFIGILGAILTIISGLVGKKALKGKK